MGTFFITLVAAGENTGDAKRAWFISLKEGAGEAAFNAADGTRGADFISRNVVGGEGIFVTNAAPVLDLGLES
jgi:hypothetical protein